MFHRFRPHRARGFAHPRHGRFGRPFEERALLGGHRRGGARLFGHGDLRWVLLRLIADKPSHGYELIKAIEESLGGAYSPSPGVIYPTLTLLEDLGLIAAVASEGARKAYGVTPEGTQALEENKSTVEGIFSRMAAVADRAGGGPAPQIVRAMENLRTAFRLKLQQGRLSEAQVTEVSAALDDAARRIESA